MTGKPAARIPAPERHGELTVAATGERKVSLHSDHGDARARKQEARRPPVKAFAATVPEGAAAGAFGDSLLGVKGELLVRECLRLL